MARTDSGKKNVGTLVSALLLVAPGFVTLWGGRVSWYGQGMIFGTTATVYAIVCLLFAAVLFYLHLRRLRK